VKTIEQEPDQSKLTRRYTEVATEFIRKSSRTGSPFFLYMPHTFPHWPVAASDRFRGKSLAGLFGDAVEEIDWSVGEVFRVLREQQVEQNTLVIFTSDNGAEGGSAGPFRDGKVTTWEGGLRVPCIARWPGHVPAGVVTPAFSSTMDLFPTFVKLAGLEMPKDRVFDGEDLTPVLLRNEAGREPLFFYYSDDQVWAVRKGRWKLHVAVNNRKMPPAKGEGDPPLLFDVQQDISERRNVAQRHPEIVKELFELINRHKASITPR
jgi:arylsulfatase A-like enzyme